MSGVAGIVGQGRAAAAQVERMCRALSHRGRGEGGVYADEQIALGMCARMPRPASDNPQRQAIFASHDGRYRLAWDGHFVGAGALRGRSGLAEAADVDSVVTAYANAGAATLSRLRGAFALALWDSAERTLLLARDRLGIKPLYYRRYHDAMAFASEAKALWAADGAHPELNASALCDLLGHLHLSGDETCFQGVFKVPAGHALLFANGHERLVRYWQPDQSSSELRTPEELGESLAERLQTAVARRLSPSGAVALALSGGIDSGGIGAIVKRLDRPLHTFSLGFDGDGQGVVSELHRANTIAKRLGSNHQAVIVNGKDVAKALPDIVARYDQPHAGSLAPYLLATRLPENVDWLLSGLGADEILRGYGRCVAMERYVGSKLTPVRVGPATRTYYMLDALTSPTQRMALLHPDVRRTVEAKRCAPLSHESMLQEHLEAPMADACLLLDLKTRLGNEYLSGTDIAFSSNAIDVALPFLDEDVVDFVLSLPAAFRDHAETPKLVLRHALAPLLSQEHLALPKAGFGLPIGAWLRGPLEPWVRDLLSARSITQRGFFDTDYVAHMLNDHETGRKSRPYLLWTLCMIEAWACHHLDGAGKAAPASDDVQHVATAVATANVSSKLATLSCRNRPTCQQREREKHAPLRGPYIGTEALRPQRISAVINLRELCFEDYETALRHQHRGSALRHARKAERAGCHCRRFVRKLHLPDIVAINHSKEERSGGAMRGDYRSSLEEMGGAPTKWLPLTPAACPVHYDTWWGIFEHEPGHRQGDVQVDERLVGYVLLRRHGNCAFYSKLLGHGAYLGRGIMYRLHLAVMEWLCGRADEQTQGIGWLVYAGHYEGAPGLWQWKRKTLFQPAYLLDTEG